jgi:uncharacterized membrane protein (DUF373 family)
MSIWKELKEARTAFIPLTLYQRFEHIIILILTGLIAVVVVAAVWTLILKIFLSLVLAGGFDPSDYSALQAVFGMIFTVIIALEFKKSLLVVAERHESVIQIRAVIMIALLAVCRKLIILDVAKADAMHVVALAGAILALGLVYWLIRDRDQRSELRD